MTHPGQLQTMRPSDATREELEDIIRSAQQSLSKAEERRAELTTIMTDLEANLLDASNLLKKVNERIFEYRSIISDAQRYMARTQPSMPIQD